MQKNEIKKDKASILAVTLIVLGLVLSIALSASLISILGNKASISSNKSNLAYSRADSGVEDILFKIKNADSSDTIGSMVACSNGVFENSSIGYKIEFKDAEGVLIKDCAAKISEIETVKSTGKTESNQRSIEVAVAAGGAPGITGGCTLLNTTFNVVWGQGCKSTGTAANCEAAADTGYECGQVSAFASDGLGFAYCVCVEE